MLSFNMFITKMHMHTHTYLYTQEQLIFFLIIIILKQLYWINLFKKTGDKTVPM